MNAMLVETIGTIGATLTTLCWLPQAVRIIRTRDTRAISLVTYAAFSAGVGCWLVYGIALANWPLIGANAVTLVLSLTILATKLRYG